jgi:hypothetical protein
MTVREKINNFIKDNDLELSGIGSNLNSNCVILAGFACYLELHEIDVLLKYIDKKVHKISEEGVTELTRVFKYAYKNAYGEYWKDPNAHDEYTFE